MADMNTPISRQELFDLVWTKPATHIAKKYGVPLATVLKACSVLGVPRPARGHWVKLAHGRTVPHPTLPPPAPGTPESTSLGQFIVKPRQTPQAEPPTIVEAVRDSEPAKWHIAAQKTRSAFRGGFVDPRNGRLHAKQDHVHLPLAVSRPSLDRALHLLNRLAWRLEREGFAFRMPEKGKAQIELVYVATDTSLEFVIREDLERYERELRPDEKGEDPSYIWDRWRYRPTGKLRVAIDEFHPQGIRKSWSDGKRAKLEDKLEDVVPGFVRCAQGKHAHELEWAERQRRWQEEDRLRREEEARRRKEEEDRSALLAASRQWADVEGLRSFRQACEAHWRSASSSGDLTADQDQWLQWVARVIMETDPITAGRVPGPQRSIAR